MKAPDHLITPLDWSAEALRHAKWAGQPARARALIESKRYLATHELIERLRAELAQAREVLRNVEWVPDHIPYATQPDYHRCPDCWSERREGHAPDCALSAALATKGE